MQECQSIGKVMSNQIKQMTQRWPKDECNMFVKQLDSFWKPTC